MLYVWASVCIIHFMFATKSINVELQHIEFQWMDADNFGKAQKAKTEKKKVAFED